MIELVYKDLSYKIIGILYDVHNKIGGGHKEIYYHHAVKMALDQNNLGYKEELFLPLIYNKKKIGKYFIDFLIENKIVLELKRGDYFNKQDINQVYGYLQSSKLTLGILANFTKHKVRIKRIVNLK